MNHLGNIFDGFPAFRLGHIFHSKAKFNIVVDRFVWKKCVALEHHADVAIAGFKIIHDAPVHRNFPVTRIFKPC